MSDHILDVAAAYSLGILDPQETERVERHVQECSNCRLEVHRLSDVSGVIPLELPVQPPPPELKQRILERARVEPITPARPRQIASPVPTPPDPRSPSPPIATPEKRRKLGIPVVSALMAAAVVLFAVGLTIGHLFQPSTTPQAEYAALVTQAVSRGDRVVALRPTSQLATKASMTLAIAPSGATRLILGPTPPPPKGRVYQLWYIKDNKPHSIGVFSPSTSEAQAVRLKTSAKDFTLAAMTVERAPSGSATGPTTKPFVLGQLTA